MAPISIGLFLSYDASGYFYKVLEVAPDVITLLEKTKKESWDFGAPYNGYSWLCCCYADSLCQTGNFEKSQFFFRKGQDFAKQINHTVSMGYSAVQYAMYYFNKGDGKGAAPCYTNSIKYFEEANWPWMIGLAWIGLGRAHMLLGDLPAAQMCIEKGSIILQNSHALRYRSFGPFSLSLLQYESGDYVKAEMNAKEALALSIKNHERHVEGIARVFLGRILGKINDLKKEDAEESILKGIRILDELRLKPHLLTGYFVLGELYANAGRREEARENLNKALSMCQEMGIEYWPDKIQEVLDRL
jgi:tetratricopeptide (TPR) repeat protein